VLGRETAGEGAKPGGMHLTVAPPSEAVGSPVLFSVSSLVYSERTPSLSVSGRLGVSASTTSLTSSDVALPEDPDREREEQVVFQEGELGVTIKVRRPTAPVSSSSSSPSTGSSIHHYAPARPGLCRLAALGFTPDSAAVPRVLVQRTPSGKACVIRTIPGTQADSNGIRPGDIIRVRSQKYS
jgi:hypothetical protein